MQIALGALGLAATLSFPLSVAAGVPAFDMSAVVKQVPMCKVLAGFVKAPCAGKLFGDIVFPALFPMKLEGLRVSQTILDLDTNDWKSNLRAWLNDGLDWLGVPERYQIPKKIGMEFEINMTLSDGQLRVPKGKDASRPEFGGKVKITTKVLSRGPLHNKVFKAGGTAKGKMHLTVAPYGNDCTEKKPDWAMMVMNLEFTGLDVDRIPDFIDGSALFRGIVNWAMSKSFSDFPAYKTRGVPICVSGKCPLPKRPTVKSTFRVNLGTAKLAGQAIEVAMGADGGAPTVRFRDHAVVCRLTEAVLAAGCTDTFVNHMANLALPVSVPIPRELVGAEGLSVAAEKFALNVKTSTAMSLEATASLSKAGQDERFSATVGAKLELRAVCDAKSFLVYLRPTIRSVKLSALPPWLMNDVLRAAVNSQIPTLDLCMTPTMVGALGVSKRVDPCLMARAAMRGNCTGTLVGAVLDAALPLTVRPAELNIVTNDALRGLLGGVRVTIEKAGVELVSTSAGAGASVAVKIAVAKDGERDELRAAAAAEIALAIKCGRDEGAVRVRPTVTRLDASSIPDWLLKATIVNLGNASLGRWQALCVLGDCASKQAVDVSFPFAASFPAGARRPTHPTCSFDSVKEASR